MFTRDALLLIGHGSFSLDAARPLMMHAEIIRGLSRFGEVAVGMLRGKPEAVAAFDALTSSVVHVVPFFLEDGYFTRIAIPQLLLARAPESRVIQFCQPLGLNKGIAALLDDRVTRFRDLFGIDPKSLSIVLVGHGSSKSPGRARALRMHAAALDTGRFGWVRIAHLEEPPFVAETLASARGHTVFVIGYFANEGVHATKDLPNMIAAERLLRGTKWPPVHDLGSIGADEGLTRLILQQVTVTT